MKKLIVIFIIIHTNFSLYPSQEERQRYSSKKSQYSIDKITVEFPTSEALTKEEVKALLENMMTRSAKASYVYTHDAITQERTALFDDDKDQFCCHKILRYFGFTQQTKHEKNATSIEQSLSMGERLLDNSLKFSQIYRNLGYNSEE